MPFPLRHPVTRQDPVADFRHDQLSELMRDISGGSADAFRALFDQTAGRVHSELEARLRDPHLVATVLAATYVEVWWLAGCHTGPGTDVAAWIDRIVARRVAECRPTPPPPLHTPDPRARRALLELASLLRRPIESLEAG